MLPLAAAALIDPPSLGEMASTTRQAASEVAGSAAKVASDFESVFASLMLKEMRKTLQPESLFGGDSGDVYGGMFDLFLGKQMAESGGFGLARMVREALESNGTATGRSALGRSALVREALESNGTATPRLTSPIEL